MRKFRIGPGEIKGVAVAPLAKAKFVPDALIFTCFPWQAYYLTNAYLWMTGDVPVQFETATNSLVCGYSAGKAGWEKKDKLLHCLHQRKGLRWHRINRGLLVNAMGIG